MPHIDGRSLCITSANNIFTAAKPPVQPRRRAARNRPARPVTEFTSAYVVCQTLELRLRRDLLGIELGRRPCVGRR